MDLLERYLGAIRRNLPAGKADDIVAELRDELVSRQEDREESLGHALDRDETAALLKDFGHPLVIAARYKPHQYLIGPDTFPFYMSVLRIVLLITFALTIVTGIMEGAFGANNVVQAVTRAFGGGWTMIFASAAIVTLVFAILERVGFPADHIKGWSPKELPDPIDRTPGQWESAFEVALTIAFLLWWTGMIYLPIPTGGSEFHLRAAPIWTEMFWPVTILVSARLVENLVQWLRPRWKLVRGILSVTTTIGGLVLLATIYRAGEWATVVPGTMAADQAAQLQDSINLGLGIAIIVIAVIWIFQCLGELWQLTRVWRTR